MLGNIIGLISCLMCAFPFFILSVYGKNSNEPISFWSGDTTLKSKVRSVKEYNEKMALLYRKCAVAFLITGIGCLFCLWLELLWCVWIVQWVFILYIEVTKKY